jgi:hypothetical protein
MEKMFEIKIFKDSGFNDVDYFTSKNAIPGLNNYKVDLICKNGEEPRLYGALPKLGDELLGLIKIHTYATYVIFTFFVSSDDNKQAFTEFIQWTIDDLNFAGYPIQGTRTFGEELINVETSNNPYLPKTETAIKKWKDVYGVIQNMRNQAADSDALELLIPKLADFRDRIKQELSLVYCEKTISRIIKAGDAGFLI